MFFNLYFIYFLSDIPYFLALVDFGLCYTSFNPFTYVKFFT